MANDEFQQNEFLSSAAIRPKLIGRAMWRVMDRFGIRRGKPIIAITLLSRDELFEDAACDAKDKGILTESEYFGIMDTDMIVRGRSVNTGRDAYVAVESSFTIADSDIVRVNRTASALRKMFPEADVWAAVYCAEISNDNSQRAEDDGVEVISNACVRHL